MKGTKAMIVVGADMHKRSHTLAAVGAATGELLGDTTVAVGDRGFAAALDWAAGLGAERIWALEDCRGVSGAFEWFLLVHGERVLRVLTRLMAGERRGRPGSRQVRPHRRDHGRSRGAARGRRAADGRRAGGRRARHPAAGRSPRAARPGAHRALQRPALAPARPVARA